MSDVVSGAAGGANGTGPRGVRWRVAALVALGGETVTLALLGGAGDPARRPLLTLALLAAANALLVVAVRAAARRPLSPGALLVAAALLRLVLLPLPPSLSTDVWRYLWEGRVALHRGDPYLVAPDDPRLAPWRDARWQRVEHRDLPTIYPPLAMALFVAPAALPPRAGLLAWKLLLCLADLAACALLLRLAAAGGWPPHRALWYTAHPLVALEVAGMGHLEPLGVAAALLCALLLSRRRPAAAGAAAAAAILVKLAPLAALPMWVRQARAAATGDTQRPATGVGAAALFLVPAVGLTALALAPVAVAVHGVPQGLTEYAMHWEFGGLLHEPLWRLLAAAGAPEAVKHALDLMKEWTGMHGLWNRAYPWAYPQLLSRLLLAILAAVVVMRSLLSRHAGWNDPVRGGAALFGGLLVCSPTVYPWYFLWVLPWAALAGRASWLWVAAAAPLLYLPALIGAPLWPWVHLAVWGPFVLLAVHERWVRRLLPGEGTWATARR